MRLIDADEIIRETDKVRYLRHIYIHQLMDRLPKVEAIPVEWVKEWAMKSENTYNREQIVEMLEDWEKENEKGK